MNYVTTNIRIPQEDYFRLKNEAAQTRKSMAAVIRERIVSKRKVRSGAQVAKMIAQTRNFAKDNARYLRGFDIVKALREMRYESKW